jgi:hypothetical protein
MPVARRHRDPDERGLSRAVAAQQGYFACGHRKADAVCVDVLGIELVCGMQRRRERWGGESNGLRYNTADSVTSSAVGALGLL